MSVRPRGFLLFTLATLFTLLALPAAAAVAPVGEPVQVSQGEDFKQLNPAVAFGPSGESVVVWENDQAGLRARFFDAGGSGASRDVTLVANDRLGLGQGEGLLHVHKEPSAAYLANGELLVTWTEETVYLRAFPFIEHRFVQDRDVRVQRFDAGGIPLGPAALATDDRLGFQSASRLAVAGDRGVVVWKGERESVGLAARVLDATGTPVGRVVEITADTTADHPAVAVGRGGFAVAWDALNGEQEDAWARAYDARGGALGRPFRLSASAEGRQRWPALAADRDGRYFAVWQSYLVDRTLVRIWGRSFTPTGPAGREFMVSRDQGTAHLAPAVARTPAGTFVVTWMAWRDQLGITGVEIGADGAKRGAEVRVTEGPIFKNYRRSTAGTGNFFSTAWEDWSDDGARIISARRLATRQ